MTQSEKQREALEHEEFIKEVLKARGGGSKETWWQLVLKSPVVVALVTVGVGGVAGALVSHVLQERLKEREYQAALMSAYTASYLEWQKSLLAEQIATTNEVLSLLGALRLHTENYIAALEPALNVPGRGNQEALEHRSKFHSTSDGWRRRAGVLGMLLAYYHDRSQEDLAWPAVIVASDNLVACAAEVSRMIDGGVQEQEAKRLIANKCAEPNRLHAEAVGALQSNLYDSFGGPPGVLQYDELRDRLGLPEAASVWPWGW